MIARKRKVLSAARVITGAVLALAAVNFLAPGDQPEAALGAAAVTAVAAVSVGAEALAPAATAVLSKAGTSGQQATAPAQSSAVDYTARYGADLAGKMARVAEKLQGSGFTFKVHAIMRIAKRIGVEKAQIVVDTLKSIKPFEYVHEGIIKLGYYNEQLKLFVAQEKATGLISTVITDVASNYIKNLVK